MNQFFSKASAPKRGQGMVEFALVFPLIMVMTMGMIEIARLLAIYSSLSNASREATRWGSVVGLLDSGTANSYAYLDCQGMKDAALRGLLLWTDHTVTIQYDHGGGTPFATCSQYSTPSAGITNGDRVLVTVVGTYQPVMPFVDTIISSQTITFVSARSIFTGITIGTPSVGGNSTCYLLDIDAQPANSGNTTVTSGSSCSTANNYAGTPILLAVPAA
jgi:Flp pilus assembly protein TadG